VTRGSRSSERSRPLTRRRTGAATGDVVPGVLGDGLCEGLGPSRAPGERERDRGGEGRGHEPSSCPGPRRRGRVVRVVAQRLRDDTRCDHVRCRRRVARHVTPADAPVGVDDEDGPDARDPIQLGDRTGVQRYDRQVHSRRRRTEPTATHRHRRCSAAEPRARRGGSRSAGCTHGRTRPTTGPSAADGTRAGRAHRGGRINGGAVRRGRSARSRVRRRRWRGAANARRQGVLMNAPLPRIT
jgi:hypothetical protein